MSTVSRIVDIPPPRRGRRELAEDTGLRLGLHIKAAEQAMMAAKTEALRSFGLTVAQYAAMLSLYYVPEQGETLLLRADEAARDIEQRTAEAFTVKEREQLTEMLGRVTALLRDDLSAE